MAQNPAKHFRLDHAKGALTPGKDADITVLEPKESVYDAAASGNNVVGWSPYNGIRLPWTVSAVWLRGRQITEGSKVLAEPGSGRFVRPLPRQAIAGGAA
jgi:allantoinase